jgi:hypothetical protein
MTLLSAITFDQIALSLLATGAAYEFARFVRRI